MGKFFNSVTGQMEDDGQGGLDFTDMFSQPTGIPAQPVSKPIDPQVVAYLQSKMKPRQPAAEVVDNQEMPDFELPQPQVAVNSMEQFSPDKYKQALKESQSRQQDLGLAQLASGIGDALARKDSGTDKYFSDLRGNIQDQTVGEFNRQKQAALSDMSTKQKMDLMDPNSEKSKAFRSQVEAMMPGIAKAYGKNWAQVSAADGDSILNLGKFKEAQETRKQQMQILMGQRKDAKDLAMSEKIQALQTPFGTANTTDDAKQLKEAYESKKNFDNKINQMIELRSKHGGEMFDREAVARGKQLSKDLLLEYKNMAKLGVLSKSDEDIINAIIPEDPLGFSFTPGQDPIMTKLKSFKDDSDKDFSTRVQTRTRNGIQGLQNPQPQKSQITDEDKAAIDWAQKNPNDPRAAQILKMHGGQ